ncbi:DEAD/DEAH box helicase [Desulfobacterium sp. N47]|uniref:DEAD/DEAH box helicase n=1 Tax=Desulfobacterium sp. N47 TaxID=3115210 RepID=UPI003CA0B62F
MKETESQKPENVNRDLMAVIMPNGSMYLEWTDAKKPLSNNSRLLQEEIYRRFSLDNDSWLLFLGFCDKNILLSPCLDYWRNFAGFFTKRLSRTPDLELLRHKAEITIEEDELRRFLEDAPLMEGSDYLNAGLLENTWLRLKNTYVNEIKKYDGTVEDFIRSYSPDIHLVGRIYFHLVENKKEELPFAFLATYSTKLNDKGKSKHLPLKFALQEYGQDNEKLLQLLTTVHRAAEKSDLVSELLENGELFHPLAWNAKEAFSFLKEIPVYEECGILCRIPNWWKSSTSGIRLNVSMGDNEPSFVGMGALVDFNAQLYLGDTQISEEEARKLLNEYEGLAFIKNKWVAVDPDKLKQTLDAYEKAKKLSGGEGLGLLDAFRFQLQPEKLLGDNGAQIDQSVTNGKWLESVIGKMADPQKISYVIPDNTFKAKLREYQQKGVNWLCFLHSLRFGACLADDMGLGKTIEVLAFLHILKSEKNKASHKASLLVVPASLIFNWSCEIERFSPGLRYFVAHSSVKIGSDAKGKSDNIADNFDLVITTYAMVQRYEWLQSYAWNYIILDEAQAIKNPGAKQSRAVKKLNSDNRIIMTGTPIENRLSDLWSLFDFLNPGLLGNINEFKGFSERLKRNNSGYSKLRKLISPYVLRRLKTDKSVISDLPDKVEMKTYSDLSRKQVLLYNKVVEELKRAIVETEGIQRKGLVLSSIIKFKQLCNHPDQYNGTTEYEEKDSGKFARLREICETIYEKREKVLVFTQFKEMTEPLSVFLESIFFRKGLILHGGVPVSRRKKIVEEFQSQSYIPFMVLSLKAGGVGLNLTEANHVIHFDRWWNPAVEDQATDRAFRIGQKKNVIVHKFITKGTVEEKIDNMLEEKKKLSNDVISCYGETLITEMKNDELMELFKLTL